MCIILGVVFVRVLLVLVERSTYCL